MTTGIIVKTEFFPLAFFLYFVQPKIEINGKVHDRNWGTDNFQLEPGEYTIKIYFPYIGSNSGQAHAKFTLEEGQVKRINYNAPMIMFSSGTIHVLNNQNNNPQG